MRNVQAVRILCSAILLLCLSLISTPRANAQFAEGQLIQGPDGSLFVFEGGQLHPIVPVPATLQDFLGVPLGSDVLQGVRIIGDTPMPAAPVTSPASTPAAPAPAPRNVGERDGIRIDVVEVERPLAFSRPPESGREWVRVRVRVTNGTPRSLAVRSWTSAINLQVANGTTWNYSSFSGTPSPSDELPMGASVVSGGAIEGNTLFQVPLGQPMTKVLWDQGDGIIIEIPVQ